MPAVRTAVVTVNPVIMIPAFLDALHAEVVSTGDSHRIPEEKTADLAEKGINPHRDMRLSHVC